MDQRFEANEETSPADRGSKCTSKYKGSEVEIYLVCSRNTRKLLGLEWIEGSSGVASGWII